MGTITVSGVRQELLARLDKARAETDKLFSILKPEALYDRPIPERHRVVFYVGHLEAFDWNLLRASLGLRVADAALDQLFALGIDPVDGGLPSDLPQDWPSLDRVQQYCATNRKSLDDTLAQVGDNEKLDWLLALAVEHRLMHAETLEYMFHQLPYSSKLAPARVSPPMALQAIPAMISIPAGQATQGRNSSEEAFGWDNEFEENVTHVPAFSVDRFKVTNGEFSKFLEAGGYSNRGFWTESDWQWITEAGIAHPVFWVRRAEGWGYRTMFEEVPLPYEWPVMVSHAEASAYARWAGKSLPSEAQWHRAAYASPEGERQYPWGHEPANDARTYWDPPAAGAFPEKQSAFEVQDLTGIAWEWTSTIFAPFPGFQISPAYPGYSANFFDGKHFVMKGGSCRTAECMLRRSFRNWFQAHYQYVYAGFRCVSH